ncbi:MAG: MFS transporter [Actinomycetota bacterium]|nr:MFS transporter [Actinomycetota bacterium]
MATNLTYDGGRSIAARNAIAAVFFVNGATFSSWLPRLPELQERLGISDAALGVTLVGSGVGGLAASAWSGWLVDRRGSRAVTVATSVALSLALPLLSVAPAAAAVFAVLVLLGALDGLTDVAMNSQAVVLQRSTGRSILSRFHALWSLGAVSGGLVASRAAAAGVSLRMQLLATAVVLAATTVVMGRWLLPTDPTRHDSRDDVKRTGRTERKTLALLFVVGMGVALAELPPNDWAALLMLDRFGLSEGAAALGFVATAGGMLVGRLGGDHVADRCGVERTRRMGAATAAIGVVVAATVPTPLVAGCGLFVTGLGLSSLFPLVFLAASELTHGSHSGMASFSSGARLGFLLASPLVGMIANWTSVATGVLVVAGSAGLAVSLVRLPRPVEAATPQRAVTPLA